MTKYTFQTT